MKWVRLLKTKNIYEMKPFLSVLVIILTLFSVAFLKMEVRRMGYVVLKENREFKVLKDQHRIQSMELAKILRPDHIQKMAKARLTMGEARNGQIIQLVGQRIAIPQ